jgi:hypothetical protein
MAYFVKTFAGMIMVAVQRPSFEQFVTQYETRNTFTISKNESIEIIFLSNAIIH